MLKSEKWTPTVVSGDRGYFVTFLRDPRLYPYVRECWGDRAIRSAKDMAHYERDGAHLIAFESNENRAKGDTELWRYWMFNPSDPYFSPGVPCEAVRPIDIKPGQGTPSYQAMWERVVLERHKARKSED